MLAKPSTADKATKPRFEFRLIVEQADLYALIDEWHELLRSSAAPAPLMDPKWVLVWWKHYGPGAHLAIGLLYDDDLLVGLAPLCIRPYIYHCGLIFRRLQFMGAGIREGDGIGSGHFGLIARRGYEVHVADAFVEHIVAGDFGTWHETVLSCMDGESRLVDSMKHRFAESGLDCDQSVDAWSQRLHLPRTWDAFLLSLVAARRETIRLAMAQFETWCERRGCSVRHATLEELLDGDGLTDLVPFGSAPRQGETFEAAFWSPRLAAFRRDYAAAMASTGNVEVTSILVGNRSVATTYMFRQGRKLVAYQQTLANDLPADLPMAVIMNILLIKEAISRGDQEIELLSGTLRDQDDFAADKRPIIQLRIARRTAREFIRRKVLEVQDRFALLNKPTRGGAGARRAEA